MEITLNFGGFYNSLFSELIENEISEIENNNDNSIDIDDIDYKSLHIDASKEILDAFIIELKDDYDVDLSFKFIDLISPKYYNYSTDTICLELSDNDIEILDKLLNRNKDIYNNFINYVKNVTTSYDGYMAFYDYDDVINKVDKDNTEVYYECLINSLYKEYNVYERSYQNLFNLIYEYI